MKISLILSITLIACAPAVALAQDGRSADPAEPTTGHAASSTTAAYDLGAVLAKRGDGGMTVMAVTPGGGAERLKLRAGDRLLSINGISLDTLTPTSTMRQALASGGGTVRLEVARGDHTFVADDREQALARGAAMAAPQGCGYVSNQRPTPSLSEKIHAVAITKIFGASTPLYAVNRYRVGAGRQVLVLAEAIPPTRFSSIQLIHRERMLRQFDARAYKVLILDVEPGVKYYVGAQLLPEKMDRRSILDNQYWQPVVWKKVPEHCP